MRFSICMHIYKFILFHVLIVFARKNGENEVIGCQSDLKLAKYPRAQRDVCSSNSIELNWIEFETDLNEFRLSFVCRFVQFYIQTCWKAITWVIEATFNGLMAINLNLNISDMINAENKSATKHPNAAVYFCYCQVFFLLYLYCENLWAYAMTQGKSVCAFFSCVSQNRMKKRRINIGFYIQSKWEILFYLVYFCRMKQENYKVLLNHQLIKKQFFSLYFSFTVCWCFNTQYFFFAFTLRPMISIDHRPCDWSFMIFVPQILANYYVEELSP